MLRAYLKRHYKIMLMLAMFIAVYAAVFSLYELPTEAVAYAGAICAVLGSVLFAAGYLSFLRRHNTLKELSGRIILSLEGLPRPKGALEDYQELIRLLFAEKTRVETMALRDRRETEDYYTMWAHQIKTPIAAMRLLLQEQDTPENAALSAELFSIEQYVEMVLNYLRLDSDSSDLVLRRYELDSVIRQAVRKFARLFIMKRLALDFQETGLTVLTDEKWLLFVIEQLLSNSLKYTRKGTISIYAEGMSLVIQDTGIGVRQEDLPRVFDRGFTGYNGREDKKSTGIGLYLCRRICGKLGHGIRMESELGRGTRVIISLASRERTFE